jgi:hypothetical protein
VAGGEFGDGLEAERVRFFSPRKPESRYFRRLAGIENTDEKGSDCMKNTLSGRGTKAKTAWGLILILSTVAFAGLHPRLFRPAEAPFSVINRQFQNYIFVGSNNGKLSTVGNTGFDFPLLTAADPAHGYFLSSGVVALIDLYMFPKDRKFYVDNFYATFGFYLSGNIPSILRWRFYPLYHLSAHLADGYITGDVDDDRRVVSNEMLYAALIYEPIRNLEVLGAYGYYYHVCEQRDLRNRIDLDAMYRFERLPIVTPYALVHNQLLVETGVRYGIELQGGVLLRQGSGAGLGLAARYFSAPHPGQYFETRENGVGLQITFIAPGVRPTIEEMAQ